MPMPPGFTKQLPEAFGELPAFKITKQDELSLQLEFPACKVEFGFERYETEIAAIHFFPANSRKKFRYLCVMILRNPSYSAPRLPLPKSIPEKDQQYYDLLDLGHNLKTHCSDLLAGDASRVEAEGYEELDRYLNYGIGKIMNLPTDDPLKKKMWAGDFSWVGDLKQREAGGR